MSSNAFAKGYFSVGGGGGGDAGSSGRVEIGGFSTDKTTNTLFGIGIPFSLNRDEEPGGTLEYPVPHTNYTRLGTKKKGNEYGLYGKFGFEPINKSSVFVFITGGFTAGDEVDLAQSNATGWYYEQSKTTKGYGLIGGGLGYFPKDQRFCIQAEYDNRMGITGSIGLSW